MKHAEYKDSSVDWIGKVPIHWNIMRGKFIVKVLPGYAFDSKKFTSDDGISLIRIRDINNTSTEMNYSGSFNEEYIVNTGDVLVGMDGDFNVAKWKGERALLNQRVCKIVGTNIMLSSYMYYLLSRLLKLINDVCYATTVKHLSTSDIENSLFPVPTIQEQHAIVAYLNEKCNKIDGAIDVQKKKIDLLNELKQTIITNAVTKGFNPDAPMKDSGVEWIGEIPEHWDMIKIKFNFKIYADATPKTDVKDYWDGDIIWITPADYKTIDKFISCGQRCITKEGYNTCNAQLVPKGTLIFSKRAPIGTVAIADTELCTNQGCLSCVPQKCSSLYYYYATSVYTEIFDLLGSGATFKEISASDFANVKLPSPDYDEQLAIVSSIEKEVLKIDAQISKANRRIELLNELKQSIITEAVTGKIKVC